MQVESRDSLRVSNLSSGYRGKKVIDDLTLPPFNCGELTAIVGPNGAGKSTLLRAMAGLVPSSGSLHFGDRDLRSLNHVERSSLIGFMPQGLPADTSLTVLESVVAALSAQRLDRRSDTNAEDQAFSILERLAIGHLALKPLNELSGGQKQVTSLAQAIVREPQIVLLDEPTNALDLHRQFHIMEMVKTIASGGKIVVVVQHDLALAARWADRIVVLRQGRLYVAGAPNTAITSATLRDVYRVAARVESCSQGQMQVMTDGLANTSFQPMHSAKSHSCQQGR